MVRASAVVDFVVGVVKVMVVVGVVGDDFVGVGVGWFATTAHSVGVCGEGKWVVVKHRSILHVFLTPRGGFSF